MLIPWVYFLKEDEQLLVEGLTNRWTHDGPGQFYVPPFNAVKQRKALTLGPTEYLHVKKILTGEVHTQIGPKMYFLGANEEIVDHKTATPLKNNEYIKVMDNSTGIIRMERGENLVYLNPTEEFVDDVQEGINIDKHQAVLIRDTETGRLQLITEPQVFFPTAVQEIVEVRKRILLEDHDTIVIKDSTGKYIFKRGTDLDRAFFLEPYSELVRLRWSAGIYKDQRNLYVTHIDSRPKFMWYEFEVRTQDNVELVIGVTFFWQIVDVEAMIRTTDDTPGDVCSHARSSIIQAVSQVSLEKFLADFNSIISEAILRKDDDFYVERGALLRAVEIRSIKCKDAGTQHILQEIIQETTNRLNRIQKQESENDVKLRQLAGDIEAENLRGQLLTAQREHTNLQGLMQGEAEAARLQAFLEGIRGDVLLPDKIGLFNTLRKQDILANLSKGNAQIYFTPSDVDLSIEARPNKPNR